MYPEDFVKRLTELRVKKGVSARDMSLSLGQTPGYINSIESGRNLPSLTAFFYICEYFDITPAEFFDLQNKNPEKVKSLCEKLKGMKEENLDALAPIIDALNQ